MKKSANKLPLDTRGRILQAAFVEFYVNGFQGGGINNIIENDVHPQQYDQVAQRGLLIQKKGYPYITDIEKGAAVQLYFQKPADQFLSAGCIYHFALLSRLRTAGDYRYGYGIILSAHRMAGGESSAETNFCLSYQIGAGRCRGPALQIFCGPDRAFYRFVLDMDVAERTERSPGDQFHRGTTAKLPQSFCLPADGRCSELGRYLGILLAHHFPQLDT